jgi:hypothetical protein
MQKKHPKRRQGSAIKTIERDLKDEWAKRQRRAEEAENDDKGVKAPAPVEPPPSVSILAERSEARPDTHIEDRTSF